MVKQQLADSPQPGLAPGELQVLPAATFAHGPVGDLICQGQGCIQPAPLEGEGVVVGFKLQRAVEGMAVQRLVVGRGMGEACRQQWQ
ncbi:hypothetical protein D3C78_1603510 [compost metagenome]